MMDERAAKVRRDDDHERHERQELDHGAIVPHDIGRLVRQLGRRLDIRFSPVADGASRMLLARDDHVLGA